MEKSLAIEPYLAKSGCLIEPFRVLVRVFVKDPKICIPTCLYTYSTPGPNSYWLVTGVLELGLSLFAL
jgi:hypothetical protein